ncbi:PD-(D/E)XK motif protein [Micrococcus luteus]|nr:PD-(D/E)XK motif protein [Micrococcus luteus]
MGREVRRLGSGGPHAVYAAVDPEGRPMLLVPTTGAQPALPGPFSVVHLGYAGWHLEGSTVRALTLRCDDKLFWDEFARLCDDILTDINEASDPAQHALAVIQKWRRMLSIGARDRLGAQQRIGLYAELSLLKMAAAIDPERALASWDGPDRAVHDFCFFDRAVEVKAVGEDSEDIHIHGLDQLQTPPSGSLDLMVATVVEDAEGDSIQDLKDDLVGLGVKEENLLDSLMAAGWTPLDQPHKYRLLEWLDVPVTGGVPKLTPSELAAGAPPEGISKVTYTIALQTLRAHASQRTPGQVIEGFMA